MTDTATEAAADDAPPPEVAPDPNAVAITVNGRAVTARKGQLVIDAAEQAGEYIPRFCYHPRMSPVGMCRQCIVEIDTGRGPALAVSCMNTVAPDMAVVTDSPIVKRAQEGILELLLANHPLDCPVCDKGGECPLQDQAFTHGPGESRYVEEKRHFEKPIPISDHILLDRERCILCDRCTRFADEVAGDKLIHFIDRGNATQVNTFPDEPFASYFSGNIAQICPVGALTAKPYRFKARPWDLQEVTSTCTGCSVGCRISVHSSRDELLRVQGVDVESVNHGWLCDRGRFSFQATDNDARLGAPVVRTADGGTTEVPWNSALAVTKDLFEHALSTGGADSIGIIGGARLTNESAFAWARLADALGITRRDAQLGDGLPAELLDLPRATINDAASAATVIVVGPDLKEEMAVLYLRLRGAVVNGYQGNHPKLIEIAPKATGLTKYAWRSVLPKAGTTGDIQALLSDPTVAAQLASGPVVVVAGRGNLGASEASALAAVQAVLAGLPAGADVRVLPALRRGNVVGALQLGLAPAAADRSATATLQAAADGKLELLVLLGADPLSDCPDRELARRGLTGARRVVALDTFLTASSKQADIVLPVAAFGEQSGTTTNLEGRVAPVVPAVTVHATARPDWMVATELAALLGHDLGLPSVEAITRTIARQVPAYAAATAVALTDVEGVLAVATDVGTGALPDAAADVPAPNSYDYRLVVSRKLYDGAVGTQMAPALAPLAIGAGAHLHPLDLDKVGVSAGSDVSIVGAQGTVVLPVVADDSVPRGVVWVPFNQPGTNTDITAIVSATAPVTDVRIERL